MHGQDRIHNTGIREQQCTKNRSSIPRSVGNELVIFFFFFKYRLRYRFERKFLLTSSLIADMGLSLVERQLEYRTFGPCSVGNKSVCRFCYFVKRAEKTFNEHKVVADEAIGPSTIFFEIQPVNSESAVDIGRSDERARYRISVIAVENARRHDSRLSLSPHMYVSTCIR